MSAIVVLVTCTRDFNSYRVPACDSKHFSRLKTLLTTQNTSHDSRHFSGLKTLLTL